MKREEIIQRLYQRDSIAEVEKNLIRSMVGTHKDEFQGRAIMGEIVDTSFRCMVQILVSILMKTYFNIILDEILEILAEEKK